MLSWFENKHDSKKIYGYKRTQDAILHYISTQINVRLQRFYECSVYVYILVPFGNLKWFPHKDIVQNGTLHKQKFKKTHLFMLMLLLFVDLAVSMVTLNHKNSYCNMNTTIYCNRMWPKAISNSWSSILSNGTCQTIHWSYYFLQPLKRSTKI